jgi:hypothetical protein
VQVNYDPGSYGDSTMSDDLGDYLRQCRERFGKAPRELEPAEREYFKVRPSIFTRCVLLLTFDKLRMVLRDHDVLRDHGRVVWGCIVQANQDLFHPANRSTLPANLLYSTDRFYDDAVEELQALAAGLFDLKGTSQDDRELQRFANAISNEMARTMKLQVPEDITDGRRVYFTTALIHPPHLPEGYLAQGFFPLVICPDKTEAVMILPARFWSKEFREAWAADEE